MPRPRPATLPPPAGAMPAPAAPGATRHGDRRLPTSSTCALMLAAVLVGTPQSGGAAALSASGVHAHAGTARWSLSSPVADRIRHIARDVPGMPILPRLGNRGLLRRLGMATSGRAEIVIDRLAAAGYTALQAYRALLRRLPVRRDGPVLPGHAGATAAHQLSKMLGKAIAMIPQPLLTDWREPSLTASATSESDRHYRGWMLGCWFSMAVWAAALIVCAVGLRRQVRRLTRTARALHRKLAIVDGAARVGAATAGNAPASGGCAAGERLGMVATLCHEIRTPMHAVIGILELLMHKTAIRGEARHYIGTAHECAKSLITLVGDVLDMAKLEAGRLEIRPEPVQLAALLRQLVHAFRPLAVAQQLRIRLRLGPLRGRRHQVDPQRLRQVVGNLLSNAIKYSHHGDIIVKVESTGDGVHGETIRIVVQDQGPGIDAQQMPRLFEPFFRGSGDGSAAGTGLGLSISRQLARQMGGELQIISRPGVGTTAIVTLVLPCVAGAGRAARGESRLVSARRMPTPPLRKGYCALVVDDHPAGRMLLTRQLRHLGVDAVCAPDGAEALALCAAGEGAFDVVITDCNMPRMDGFMLTRRLRAQERALARRRLPVLGYSADARQQNLERALAAGMDDCLFKPIELDALARVLHRWLRDPPPDRPARIAVRPMAGAGPVPFASVADAAPGNAMSLPESAPADTDAAIRDAMVAGNAADLAALRLAFDARDWRAMRAIAHRIKGVTRMTAAHAAASCCEAVEAACQLRDADAAGDAIASLAQALDELARGDMRF